MAHEPQAQVQLLHWSPDRPAPGRQAQVARRRDFQRSRVYTAERYVPFHCRGRSFFCLDDMQAYAMRVTADPGFRRRFPERPLLTDSIVIDSAQPNQARALCFPDESRITFARDRTREMELLHEITHAALATGTGHCEEFVVGFLWNLARWLPKAAPHFYDACHALGVKPLG